MTRSISYLLKTPDYYFPLVLNDEWWNISSTAADRLKLCRRHVNTWLCMCALVTSCVNLDSYTCVVDYSTPCYGWLNLRGVDILSWPRWKVQWLRSFFFFVLLFSFWRETTSLFIQSSVCVFILWERALLSCRRMIYGAFYWSVIQNNKQEELVWNMSCSAFDFWCKHELCLFVSSFSVSLLVFLSLQVAIIAGNFELAELIKNHKEKDIGKKQSSSSSFLLLHPPFIPHLFFSRPASFPESRSGYISNPPVVWSS